MIEIILSRITVRLNDKKHTPPVPEQRTRLIVALSELNSPDFKLLVGLTLIAVVEGITYAWIEVLLYTSTQVQLMNTWVFGHFTSYNLVLALLVLVMVFGTGFVAWTTYSPTKFRKFFLLALGDFLLWLMVEDEFTFVFSRAAHTATDWTNWPIGALEISGNYIPSWYIMATVTIFMLWFFGLSVREKKKILDKSTG